MVVFSDGTKALLPLSMAARFRGLVRKYYSSPAGTFGGWLSTDQLTVEHAVRLARYLSEELGALHWRLNPYDPLLSMCGIRPSVADETQVLDLSGGFGAISRKWTGSAIPWAVRKAGRAGLRADIASTREDWRAYYETYEASLQRWGRPTSVYGWELFDMMFARNSPNIRLWCARVDGRIVAGALCFYSTTHVAYWHGAALEEYFRLRPVNLLIHEIVRDACERGHRWFDFNPSGGHESVKAFKKGFGAEERPSGVVQRSSRAEKVVGALSRLTRLMKRA
jgi:hypothetical protein